MTMIFHSLILLASVYAEDMNPQNSVHRSHLSEKESQENLSPRPRHSWDELAHPLVIQSMPAGLENCSYEL